MFHHSPPISATLVPQYPKLCKGWFALIVGVFFLNSRGNSKIVAKMSRKL